MRTQYLYDDVTGACIAEFDENGDAQVEYTTNPQTGELISENHDGQEVYHRYDGEGNTRQTTDSAGNVLGEATYDAFGETVAESGDMKTSYRFRGHQGFATDPVTGDVYKSSKVYSPSLGRWLTETGFEDVRRSLDLPVFNPQRECEIGIHCWWGRPVAGDIGLARHCGFTVWLYGRPIYVSAGPIGGCLRFLDYSEGGTKDVIEKSGYVQEQRTPFPVEKCHYLIKYAGMTGSMPCIPYVLLCANSNWLARCAAEECGIDLKPKNLAEGWNCKPCLVWGWRRKREWAFNGPICVWSRVCIKRRPCPKFLIPPMPPAWPPRSPV